MTRKLLLALASFILVCCTASAQTATPADFFGFSISPTTLTNPGNFPSVGFGSMRVTGFNSQWSHFNTAPGVYNFTDLDSWLALANAQGKEVLLGVYFTPSFISSNSTGSCPAGAGTCYPPSDLGTGDATWKAYITALVNHSLASSTAKVTYYEMWNEIDGSFWKGTSSDMVTLVKDATAIIHAKDPNAKVLSPSVSSFNPNGTGQGYTALNAYFAAGGGAAGVQDIINIHSYPPGTPPIQPTQLPGTITALKALMTTYGIGGLPIWFTEDGWNGSAQTTMTSDQQVAWVGQSRIFEWSGGVHTGNWFQWDSPTIGTFWTSGGGVNTAGVAYGQLYTWLFGSFYNGGGQDGSTLTWTFNLTLSDNSQAQILFNNNSTPTVTLPTNYTQYRTLDNSTVNTITSNQVTLGIKPIMVTAPPAAPAQVTPAPTSITFPNQTVSQTSIPQTLTLTNTGGQSLTFSSNPVLSGANVGDFAISAASTCISGLTLTSTQSCTIVTVFTPQVAGLRSAVVSISDSAPGSPHTATLTGTGFASVNNQITVICPSIPNCKVVGSITVSSGTAPPTPASVVIAPTTGSVTINGTFPLVGVVSNDPNNLGVTWAVSGSNCSGAACGIISPTFTASGATAVYTAPPTSPGSIVITARAAANQSSFQANVTVVTPAPPPAGPTGVNVFTPPCAVSGTTKTCSFTGYQGPTLILGVVSQSTSSALTGVQACMSGSGCANLTLVGSQDLSGQKEVYLYRGINIGAGFNQVVISSSDTNLVNVAIFDTMNVGAFDTFNVKTAGATTNPTGPSLTTATANELDVCVLGTTGVASAINTPFVFDRIGNSDGAAGAINATASAISPSWTTTSGSYAAICGAFGVGTTPPAVTVLNNPRSSNVQSSATQAFTATVGNDAANQGVTWSCTPVGSCGSFSPSTTPSGTATTWTAPSLVPAGSNITLLHHTSFLDQSAPFTIPITASTSGTGLCVEAVWNTGTGTMTVTDSRGETWGTPIDALSQSGLTGSIDCLPNNVGGVGSITVAIAGSSPTSVELYEQEHSGLLTASIVDQFTHAPGFVSPMDSGLMAATTNASDVLLGLAFNGNSSSFTAGNDGQGDNYTLLDQQNFLGSAVEGFFPTTSTNTYKATITPSAASGSGMMVVALKGSTGSGSGNANITITSTSVADNTKAASSTVTLTAATPPISVVVNPNSGTLTAGSGSISITPTVTNDAGAHGVTWTLNGQGSISPLSSASGTPTVYTPPASVSTATMATITAVSVTDSTKAATATILINPPTQTGGGGTTTSCNPSCPAFIGAGGTAMGSGAETTGGRGGAVCLVTNLNDSGSGSFRGCATATGTRTVEFRVSGLITALSRFQIFNPFMTIAGQTAPGGGIVVQEAPQCTAPNGSGGCSNANQCQTPGSGCGVTFISTHDIVVRYLTYIGNAVTATGPSTGTVGFETTSGNDFNIVYDHISCRWWGNACVDIFTNGPAPGALARNITVQYGLFYEANSAHPIIIKSDTTQNGLSSLGVNRDYHHNMAVNYGHRWGLFNSGSTRWVNNLSFNGLIQDSQNDFAFLSWGKLFADLIGNKYVDGPQTVSQAHMFLFQSAQCLTPDQANNCPNSTVPLQPGDNEGPPSIYMVNNQSHPCSATVTFSCTIRQLGPVTTGVNDATQKSQTFQGWEGAEQPKSGIPIAAVPSGWYRSTPLASPVFPITVDPVGNLDAVLLPTVGNSQHLDCQGNFVSNRDSQDARVIAQYQNGGPGGAYNTNGSDTNYKGPANNPSIPAGTACPMTFATGIYDGWIQKFGLPTNNANLFNLPDARSGLTYGEDFLDGVVPSVP